MRSKKLLLLASVWVTAQLFPLPARSQSVSDSTLARVGKKSISLTEFEAKLRSKNLLSGQKSPTSSVKKSVLEEMIDDLLVEKKAAEYDFKGDQESQNRIKQYRNRTAIELLTKNLVGNTVSVPDSVVAAHYQANRETGYKIEEAVKLRQIFISLERSDSRQSKTGDKKAQKEALAKCKEIYKRLKKGTEFAQLAKAFSNHKSSTDGGEMGFVSRGELPSEVEKAVFEAQPGLFAKPIQSPYGYHIVEVFEHRPQQYQELTGTLQEAIRQTLKEQREKVRANFILDSLSQVYPPKFNQGAIDKLIASQPNQAWLVRVSVDTLQQEYFSTHYQEYLRNRRIQSSPANINSFLKGQADTLVLLIAARKLKLLNSPEVTSQAKKFRTDLAKQKIYQSRPPLEFNPSRTEIQAYYESHKNNWREERPIYVQHIVFSDSSQAGAVRNELMGGLDFKQAALKYYPGETEIREIAYDLGFISELEMPRPFYQAALGLQPGEISQPVKTEYGWHLIKLVSRNEYKPLDQVQEEIRQILLGEKTGGTQSGWRAGLRKGTNIWINQKLLEGFQGQMTETSPLQHSQEGMAQ